MWESDGVSHIQVEELHLAHADAKPYGDYRPEQFTVLSRIERRARQLIPSIQWLFEVGSHIAYLPYKIIGSLDAKP